MLHFILVCGLYAWLTLERQIAVLKREVRIGDFVNAGADPERSKRIARNLANQFELPMFAMFAGLFLYIGNHVAPVDIAAAWLFLAGRLIHSGVQTLTTNIPLRGIVYTITFVAVIMLMGRVALVALVAS